MSDNDSAELSVLLDRVNAHVAGTVAHVPESRPPSKTDAMAMYFIAARLVEMQLQLAEPGACDDGELAITREVLLGTLRTLRWALDGGAAEHIEPSVHLRPTLRVVDGGIDGGKPRRRRSTS